MHSKKQFVLVVAMIVTLGLVTVNSATARGKGNWQCATGCDNFGVSEPLDEKAIAARTKFHNDNKELRREMVTRKAEFHALMQQDNPDENKAGKLSAEIFDLRETLHKKAQAAGLPGPRFQRAGWDPEGCQGFGADKSGKQGRGYGQRAMWN